MNKQIQKLLETLGPFLILGVSIALFIGLFILMSYVLVWGLVIGGCLWLIAFIKDKFFPNTKKQSNDSKGRVIDHKDIE
jgi:hypothetical protein